MHDLRLDHGWVGRVLQVTELRHDCWLRLTDPTMVDLT